MLQGSCGNPCLMGRDVTTSAVGFGNCCWASLLFGILLATDYLNWQSIGNTCACAYTPLKDQPLNQRGLDFGLERLLFVCFGVSFGFPYLNFIISLLLLILLFRCT